MSGRACVRQVMIVVRCTVTLAAVWLGSVLAFGAFLSAQWADHPWSGARRNPTMMVTYYLLAAALVIAPMIVWWLLMPRWRWGGLLAAPLFTAVTFYALIGGLG